MLNLKFDNIIKTASIIPEEDYETEQLPGFSDKIRKHKNIYLIDFVKNLSIVKKFKIKNDDVFIVGMPKSGNYPFLFIINKILLH